MKSSNRAKLARGDSRKEIEWPLDQLREHPAQQLNFGDLPEAQFEDLVESLQKHGQRHAIEILPDGHTIVTGHQRVRAARRLGWTKIRAIIRNDLAEAGTAAVEQHLIEDNLDRRHLSRLALARCYRRLKELERNRSPGTLQANEHAELRDRVGRKLNVSGRNLDRYLRVLDTPRAVQEAFERNDLSLVLAGKVAGLSRSAQEEIAERIGNGESAKAVVADYVDPSNGRHLKPGDACAAFASALERGVADLDGRVDRVSRSDVAKHRPILGRGHKMIAQLLERCGDAGERDITNAWEDTDET
jgi:ParB/RepB/Spo0J family partition protein